MKCRGKSLHCLRALHLAILMIFSSVLGVDLMKKPDWACNNSMSHIGTKSSLTMVVSVMGKSVEVVVSFINADMVSRQWKTGTGRKTEQVWTPPSHKCQ